MVKVKTLSQKSKIRKFAEGGGLRVAEMVGRVVWKW